jgi:FtsP/CotA-like multicopper oxidase with cupredoxin domain
VNPGDTVTFTNNETDGTTHQVAGAFSSALLKPGQSFSTVVGSAAAYDYFCSQHPYMTGTVRTGSAPPPTTPPATTKPPTTPPPTTKPPTTTASPTMSHTPVPTGTTTAPPPTTTAPPAGLPAVGPDMGDGIRKALYTVVDGVKVFDLTMSETSWEVQPGVVKKAWTFNGVVPGPAIVVNEGDKVRFNVLNRLPEHTAVHWHGMVLPNAQDGVPGVTQDHIMPGERFTYDWTAKSTGTHWYHAHEGGTQVGRGLYGALIVNPALGGIAASKHYTLMVNDGANGFTLNGKSFPATKALTAKVGEKVHVRLIGTGPEMLHPMHLHGMPFEVVAQDGFPLASPYKADTLTVGVGQTFDIVFTPTEPGDWLLHCHIFSHSESPAGMTGLVTKVSVTR